MGLADQVAANIRAARKARKLSLQKLAAKVSRPGKKPAHYTTISRLEDGERGLTLDWLERIAAALEMEPVELLTGQSSVWQGFTLSEQVASEVARFQADILSDCAGDESIAIAQLAAFQRELFALVARHPAAATNITVALQSLSYWRGDNCTRVRFPPTPDIRVMSAFDPTRT